MYKVITAFRDDKDGNMVYQPGEEYNGPTDEERLHTLTTIDNRIKKVLIQEDPSKESLQPEGSEEDSNAVTDQTKNGNALSEENDVPSEEKSDDLTSQIENVADETHEEEVKKTKSSSKKSKQKSKD